MNGLHEDFDKIDGQGDWATLFEAMRKTDVDKKLQVKAAKLTDNFKRNRYRDVLPYDHTRVALKNSEDENDYINASFVSVGEAERKYILTQGPLDSTAGHFWQMIWEQNSKAVIMLNRVIEKNQPKCSQYFPMNDSDQSFSSQASKSGEDCENMMRFDTGYQVKLLDEKSLDHFVLRKLELQKLESSDEKPREILHYQFISWPDFGTPERSSDFLEFLLEVRKSGCLDQSQFGPPVVHCSAGIGRSGSFILVDSALVIVHSKGTNKLDLVKMVSELRRQRMGLIQTHDQLRFSWKTIIDALEDPAWKDLLETAIYVASGSSASASLVEESVNPDNGQKSTKRPQNEKRPQAQAARKKAGGAEPANADLNSVSTCSPPTLLAEMRINAGPSDHPGVYEEEMVVSPAKKTRSDCAFDLDFQSPGFSAAGVSHEHLPSTRNKNDEEAGCGGDMPANSSSEASDAEEDEDDENEYSDDLHVRHDNESSPALPSTPSSDDESQPNDEDQEMEALPEILPTNESSEHRRRQHASLLASSAINGVASSSAANADFPTDLNCPLVDNPGSGAGSLPPSLSSANPTSNCINTPPAASVGDQQRQAYEVRCREREMRNKEMSERLKKIKHFQKERERTGFLWPLLTYAGGVAAAVGIFGVVFYYYFYHLGGMDQD